MSGKEPRYAKSLASIFCLDISPNISLDQEIEQYPSLQRCMRHHWPLEQLVIISVCMCTKYSKQVLPHIKNNAESIIIGVYQWVVRIIRALLCFC